MLYHKTEAKGCRYKCHFTRSLDDLKHGDVAVFSTQFDFKMALRLVKRGVLIAFESIESPVHVQVLTPEQEALVGSQHTNAQQQPLPDSV